MVCMNDWFSSFFFLREIFFSKDVYGANFIIFFKKLIITLCDKSHGGWLFFFLFRFYSKINKIL